MLGVVFFLVTRTVENGGQLFGLNPALVGWLPTAVIGRVHLGRHIEDTLMSGASCEQPGRRRLVLQANDARSRQPIVQGQMLGIGVQPQHTERRGRPGEHAADDSAGRRLTKSAACPVSVTARRCQARMPKVCPLRTQLST